MIHTFIQAESKKTSPKKTFNDDQDELLQKIQEYWPRCTASMTTKTATIIYQTLSTELKKKLSSDVHLAIDYIKTIYKNRKNSTIVQLRTADFTVKGFDNSQETLLKLMYLHWPRRVASLTSKCKKKLQTAIRKDPEYNPELHDLETGLDFVFAHRKFQRGYWLLPIKPGMTEEEEIIIDQIYKHWPPNASKMNQHVAKKLSQELNLLPKTIEDSFNEKRWSREPCLRGDMTIRAHAAIIAGRLDLLQYYIEHDDDINEQDNDGLTLLMVSDQHSLKCFDYLLTNPKLDLSLTNNKGQNVMIYICANWSSKISYKMQQLLQLNNSHVNINNVDNARKSMLFYACDTSKLVTIQLLINEPALQINTSFFGKTILKSMCELQKTAVVRILLKHPKIEVLDTISIINDHSLVNAMIKNQIVNQIDNQSSSSSSSSSSSTSTVDNKGGCGHYSLDQGRSGICYILSVITLFHNAPEILEELKSKSSKTTRSIIKLLTDDYSTYDFSKTCPKIPPGWKQAITNNRVTRTGALTKNGGSAFTLLLYILNTIDYGTDIGVQIYHKNNKEMSERDIAKAVQSCHQDFIATPRRLGYIDLGTRILLLPSFFVNLRGLMEQHLNICGFVFRVKGIDVDHVVAAGVCGDRSIHICNSWENGCQTDFSEFVNDITNWGSKTLTIKNIAFLLYIPTIEI